jgi:shikimate dehydrogenase
MYKFGILAYPTSHSLSPILHNYIFRKNNLDACYTRYEIDKNNLPNFIKNWINDVNCKGLSVSVPYKELVLNYCDSISESVKFIGSANTILKKNKEIYGGNTDWLGFINSLKEKFNPIKKNILVTGSGGTTRAVVYGLIKENVNKIYIYNRTKKNAEILKDNFSAFNIEIEVVDKENLLGLNKNIDCIVNTTSLGMKGENENLSPLDKKFFLEKHVLFDIVYNPKITTFLQYGQNKNSKIITGEKMLIYQAIEQSKLFFDILGLEIPKNIKTGMINSLSFLERKTETWVKPDILLNNKISVLDQIIENKKNELFLSDEYIKVSKHKEFLFYKKLSQIKKTPHIISEIKPASPSKGKIFKKYDTIGSIAKLYESNEVSAISVLTDFKYFSSLPENLRKIKKHVSCPILRKDFIISKSQIRESVYLGADAVLLMKSILTTEKLEEYIKYAHSLFLDVLVEVHTEIELREVLENTSANIIGINNRDLTTLKIDKNINNRLLSIAKSYPDFFKKIWVSESGMDSREDIEKYSSESNAVLIGTGILEKSDKERENFLKSLI